MALADIVEPGYLGLMRLLVFPRLHLRQAAAYRSMNDILTGNFAVCRWQFWPPQAIRVVNWNIDRGLRLPEIADFLASQQADLLTLQEVDLNARRTHLLNVAEELARKLGMNYVFGREF